MAACGEPSAPRSAAAAPPPGSRCAPRPASSSAPSPWASSAAPNAETAAAASPHPLLRRKLLRHIGARHKPLPLDQDDAGLIAEDFDADGDADIMPIGTEADRLGVVPTLFTNQGPTAALRVPLVFGPTIMAREIDTGDFNGDGLIDLALTRLHNSGLYELTILPGFALASFQPPLAISGLLDDFELQVTDYDGDELSDLLLDDPASELRYWRQTGTLPAGQYGSRRVNRSVLRSSKVPLNGRGGA